MSIKLGLNAVLAVNTGTAYNTPTWTVVPNVKDLTLTLEANEADVSARNTGGWKATVPTLKDASIEFDVIWDTTQTAFMTLFTAYLNGSTVDVVVLDGPATTGSGAQGLRAICAVTKFTRNEQLAEAITANVTLKPTYSTNTPVWITM